MEGIWQVIYVGWLFIYHDTEIMYEENYICFLRTKRNLKTGNQNLNSCLKPMSMIPWWWVILFSKMMNMYTNNLVMIWVAIAGIEPRVQAGTAILIRAATLFFFFSFFPFFEKLRQLLLILAFFYRFSSSFFLFAKNVLIQKFLNFLI